MDSVERLFSIILPHHPFYTSRYCSLRAITIIILVLAELLILFCLTLTKRRPMSGQYYMFVDFISAFTTIQAHLMLRKLTDKNITSKHIRIHKFLAGRLQYFRFKHYISICATINTGAPQGCVLSTSLFAI